MSLTIRHVSFSSSGGAGNVAKALAGEQFRLGHDSKIISATDSNLREQSKGFAGMAARAGLDNFLIRSSSHASLMSVLRESSQYALDTSGQPVNAILNLHWVAGLGLNSLFDSIRPRTPVFWTLHDMAPFTGGCHYSLGCSQFTQACSRCPAVKGIFRPLVYNNHRGKEDLLRSISPVVFIAPSKWMAREASRSSLLSKFEIRVIPNPITIDENYHFLENSTKSRRDSQGSQGRPCQILVIAKDLSAPVKGVDEVVRAFNVLNLLAPGDFLLTLVGANGEVWKAIPGITWIDSASSQEVGDWISKSDVLVVASVAENFGLVIIEAASQGVPSLVRSRGGMPELVGDLGAGEVFDSSEELTKKLLSGRWRLSLAEARQLSKTALETFGKQTVASKYLDLYQEFVT